MPTVSDERHHSHHRRQHRRAHREEEGAGERRKHRHSSKRDARHVDPRRKGSEELRRRHSGTTKTKSTVLEETRSGHRAPGGGRRKDSFVSVGLAGEHVMLSDDEDDDGSGSVHEFRDEDAMPGDAGEWHVERRGEKRDEGRQVERAKAAEPPRKRHERPPRHGHHRSRDRNVRRVRSHDVMGDKEKSHRRRMRHRPSYRVDTALSAVVEEDRHRDAARSHEAESRPRSKESKSTRRSKKRRDEGTSMTMTTTEGGAPMSTEVFRALGPSPRVVAVHGDAMRAGTVAVSRGLMDGSPACVSLPSDMLLAYFPAGTCPKFIEAGVTHAQEMSGADAARVAWRAMRKRNAVTGVPTIEGGFVVLFPKHSFPRPSIQDIHPDGPELEEVLSSEDEAEAKVDPGDDCICVIS